MLAGNMIPAGILDIIDRIDVTLPVEEEAVEETVDNDDLEKDFLNPTEFLEVSSERKRRTSSKAKAL
jgi:hypothetical protein